jgi:alpha-D-ribose 1-methylphosphonate 5-triphosphate synthase subunit PhnG
MQQHEHACAGDTSLRQHWMAVLARTGAELDQFADLLRARPYERLRPAQTGMVMVQARAGGDGRTFNLGEMTVTRCVVKLDEGTLGYSYMAGRQLHRAELAALADAHLQGADHSIWMQRLIQPLAERQERERVDKAQSSAGTRVQFSTLVRGEG